MILIPLHVKCNYKDIALLFLVLYTKGTPKGAPGAKNTKNILRLTFSQLYKKSKNWKLEVSNTVPVALKPNSLPLHYISCLPLANQ